MDSGASTPPGSRFKPLLDFGPLLAFFLVNAKWGLLYATAVLIPLSVVALVVSWKIGHRAPDHEYTRPSGSTARFSDLWSEGPALFVWLRHCG